MNIILILLACVIPYLIGSINFSIILSKKLSGKDIRESGSGNAGATNMLRTYGKKLAALTLLLDVLKGCAGIWFGVLLTYLSHKFFVPSDAGLTGISVTPATYNNIMTVSPYFNLLGGLFAALGHNYPVFFGFKGGKGVATSLGIILALDWRVGLIVFVLTILIMAVTKYVSLGSVLSPVIYFAADIARMIFTNDISIVKIIFNILLGGMLIFRHKENIKRLMNGTENKLGKKKE